MQKIVEYLFHENILQGRTGVILTSYIVDFEQISHIVLVFLLFLLLNK